MVGPAEPQVVGFEGSFEELLKRRIQKAFSSPNQKPLAREGNRDFESESLKSTCFPTALTNTCALEREFK